MLLYEQKWSYHKPSKFKNKRNGQFWGYFGRPNCEKNDHFQENLPFKKKLIFLYKYKRIFSSFIIVSKIALFILTLN